MAIPPDPVESNVPPPKSSAAQGSGQCGPTIEEVSMKSIRLEPELEDGTGERYGWRLVVEFDPDWQNACLQLGGDVQGGRFSVHVPDDWVEGMAIPEVMPDA